MEDPKSYSSRASAPTDAERTKLKRAPTVTFWLLLGQLPAWAVPAILKTPLADLGVDFRDVTYCAIILIFGTGLVLLFTLWKCPRCGKNLALVAQHTRRADAKRATCPQCGLQIYHMVHDDPPSTDGGTTPSN